MSTSNEIQQEWQRLIDPTILRANLKVAALYIAAYEILKDNIISRIQTFFSKWDKDGLKLDQAYQTEVLSRNKSPVYASLSWLQTMKAISDEDMMNPKN